MGVPYKALEERVGKLLYIEHFNRSTFVKKSGALVDETGGEPRACG